VSTNLDTATLKNIEHLGDSDFLFLNHDMIEHLELDEPLAFVVHLARPASPIDYARLPLHALWVVRTARTTRSAS
jgi:dTDP-glucose 4,6-dehydratase